MSSSSPPLFPETDVFIPYYWRQASDTILTQAEADTRYLKFPVGQGTESIPNLIVAGSSTLGIVSTNTLNASGLITANQGITSIDSSIAQTASSGNSAIEFFSNSINGFSTGGNTMNLSMDNGFDFINYTSQRHILTDPTYGTTQYSNYISISQVPILTIGIEIPNPTTTATIKCEGAVSTPTTLLLNSFNQDDNNSQISIISGDNLGTSSIIKLECLSSSQIVSSIEMSNSNILFNSPSQLLSIGELASLPTSFFSSFIKFDTERGMLSQSVINTTTTGQTTLSNTDAFRTIINTPTSGTRVFILPAFVSTPSSSGFWYAICNKSAVFTIAVEFPLGTTIFTIPVSPASGIGSIAKFAVDSANTAYFRAG